jgi:hypothetical protein
MNRLPLLGGFVAWLVLLGALTDPVRAQSIFDQRQLVFSTNASPTRGVNWAPQPPGQSLPSAVSTASPKQFRGAIVYGGVTKQGTSTNALVPGNFAANVNVINWPRSVDGGQVSSILRAAVGAPYLSHGFDFLFGQEITPPLTDLTGLKLTADQTNFWHPEPIVIQTVLTTNSLTSVVTTNYAVDPAHSGTEYYWSPHANKAYATKAGPVQIMWRTANSTDTTLPPGGVEGVTHVRITPFFYAIKQTQILVSGVPFKTPRKMYWTKGDYEKTGKPILIPTGVKSIQFVYNNSIPQTVPDSEVVIGGIIKPNTGGTNFNNGNVQAFTGTIAVENGFITAYNREGRIFMELLGDATGVETKRQLGIEIVDVQRDAVPSDVAIELGERATAFPGNEPSDFGLFPSPINQLAQAFAYQRSVNAIGDLELYATRITQQLTDYQVHWMEEGVGGLRWPFRFVRYTFVWPSETAKYSHYVRPVVPDEAAARLTAIPLPGENAPKLDYQDPSNNSTPRAKLTEDSQFYTFLDTTQPVLRALIRYNVGDRVAFERVFSWLDATLKSPSLLAGTIATNLEAWGENAIPSTNFTTAPRVLSQTVYVGDRLAAPGSELGSAGEYFAGYINQAIGISFSPTAYKDPFVSGFEAANEGAIIPVNAIPNQNNLEVWWFRRHAPTALRDEALGFQPTYWPAVIGQYTVEYPGPSHPRYRQIVLASNHGSGPLSSFESAGSLYIANTNPSTVGFNPNEEHALIQGGQIWALRDDLNVTNVTHFSSLPYVLLQFSDADGRPNMAAFHVVRETATDRFDYTVAAGTILQPPMPLPLLDKPVPPTGPTEVPYSLNAEVGSREIADLVFPSDDTNSVTVAVSLSRPPVFPNYETLRLQKAGHTNQYYFYPGTSDFRLKTITGVISEMLPVSIVGTSDIALPATRYRFTATNAVIQGIANGASVAIGYPTNAYDESQGVYTNYVAKWNATVTGRALESSASTLNTAVGYLELDFGTGVAPANTNMIVIATRLYTDETTYVDVAGSPGGSFPTHHRYSLSDTNRSGLSLGDTVIVSNPDANKNWRATIAGLAPDLSGTPGYVEVDFGSGIEPATNDEIKGATILVKIPITKNAMATAEPSGFRSGWRLAFERLADLAAGATQQEVDRTQFDNQITFQDRKGSLWVYRGPHTDTDAAARSMQFYYKTLPGFWFPVDAAGNVLGTTGLNEQPAEGTITPYLRPIGSSGGFDGDAVYGYQLEQEDDQGRPEGDGNALGITYRARWPETAPVLQMAETLTVPKRGLPAIRGQTSLQVLYQQSVYLESDQPSVVLHDPTAAKKFPLFDTNPDGSATGLNKLPSSIQTSIFRGKTYFPRLSPHLAERFYFDPNDSKNGSLVFLGEFKNEALGESYLQPNFLSQKDIEALKELCSDDDESKAFWDQAIDDSGSGGLTLQLETFYPNPAKPGTFTSTIEVGGLPVHQAVEVHAGDLAQVTHSDTAVDSYALTATGPGTGYISIIAGQGMAFTPPEEPVSIKIIKVVDTLYRGEVKVILSSNPLAEKVTMQQVVDLAGKVENYDFEWWIAAPTDGAPPAVYGNTTTNLLFSGSPDPWHHLHHPLASDTPASLGPAGFPNDSRRFATDVSSLVVPVRDVPFTEVTAAAPNLRFKVTAQSAQRLAQGNPLVVRDQGGTEIPAVVSLVELDSNATTAFLTVNPADSSTLPIPSNVFMLYERGQADQPQSLLYRDFEVPSDATFSRFFLSLGLDDALGAKVYLDGELVVTANLGEDDTSTTSAPSGFSPAPLPKVYTLGPHLFAGGTTANGVTTHRIAVELFSNAGPDTGLRFNSQLDAYQSADLVDIPGSKWLKLDPSKYPDKVRTILGESADVRALSDNYVISRYRANDTNHASFHRSWSQWTDPALAEGWIKRVLAGINPFNQRATDLFNNTVNTDANILTSAGKRWEGDVALNLDSINDYGLIEIYETVLRRGKDLSINAGISYDPANDALLLAAGYLNDLYMLIGNEARSDAANPTIGIGTKDKTYGDIATALFSFKGQLPSLLEEELALLRGRDDFFQPGVRIAPVYNRLIWNYTRGIDSGEVIYALNYNILDQNTDGKVDAADAAKLFPQGHGDAYGHYLTALKGYYSLLIDKDFAWVPRIEAVNILGKPVAVDYQDERKFAAAAAAVARTGRQIFELTWRKDYEAGQDVGWEHFSVTRENTGQPIPTRREWGMDHWAARTGEGAYLHWALGNSILPPVDPDPTHEGIQKVDRTTVPDLKELAATAAELQTAMDNAEGRLTPLGLAPGSLAFDINPNQVTGTDPKAHFDQIYERAIAALNNAVASFDDAKDVTRLMRSEQDSLAELQASVAQQELAYTSSLIELYGTPYPDDIGPGKLYKQGYAGPDLFHYNYVETETIEAPGVYTPNEPDYVAKIDIQQLNANWSYIDNPPRTDLSTNGPVDGSSSDLVIVNINDPKYEEVDPVTGKKLYYIPYAFGSHGFFDKPASWTSKRQSPGKIQQAISELIQAHDRMYYALAAQCESDKQDLDKAVQVFKEQLSTFNQIKALEELNKTAQETIDSRQTGYDIANKWLTGIENGLDWGIDLAGGSVPDILILGLAASVPVKGLVYPTVGSILTGIKAGIELGDAIAYTVVANKNLEEMEKMLDYANQIADLDRQQQLRESIFDLGNRLKGVQGDFQVINEKLRILDDTKRRYAALVAEGDRIQQEREVFRQRSAAIVQGFRTRDAAFRIFRNEKLERYKSLFDLSARYTYLAANAYDYDTGLLNTPKGRDFVARIVNSRALGVVKNGDPQFAGSNLGDPGLSSVLAEMNADWTVLKGRLGFNNPTAYGTTFSLRTEKHRILPGDEGASFWKDVLNQARKPNVLEDPDVKRFCMQIDPGNGLPLPGLVIEFETTVADGLNFFGQPQQAWDHYFDSSSFATKVFGVGVALEGYIGMENPVANTGAINAAGGSSTPDPNLAFLDPNGLGATPGIYLVPVGLDSMRSPALGDAGNIRTWSVDDVTIPLPFNIGDSDFSSKALYQSNDSLSEPLFGIRKHASFRPVSTTAAFSSAIYGSGGALQRSQFTNTRLIGRSVWNSKWKLVIPGTKLLRDPDEGLRRFINSVSDIKLHLVTYSYAGN